MGRRLANILTMALLIVAAVLIFGIGVILVRPDIIPRLPTSTPEATPILPTLAAAVVVPSVTNTIPADALAPTFTPNVPDTPAPATATNTRRPTLTPSNTPIFPTRTNTPTPTRTPTPTVTEGPSPTQTNTISPFPFTKTTTSPQYLRNYTNSAGCDWLGIAGEVLDPAGNPVEGNKFVVHIWDSGIDVRLDTGTAPAYGASGWEQFVLDRPVIRDYNIQLETKSGTTVSQVYRVQTRSSCNENLLYFIFLQNREID